MKIEKRIPINITNVWSENIQNPEGQLVHYDVEIDGKLFKDFTVYRNWQEEEYTEAYLIGIALLNIVSDFAYSLEYDFDSFEDCILFMKHYGYLDKEETIQTGGKIVEQLKYLGNVFKKHGVKFYKKELDKLLGWGSDGSSEAVYKAMPILAEIFDVKGEWEADADVSFELMQEAKKFLMSGSLVSVKDISVLSQRHEVGDEIKKTNGKVLFKRINDVEVLVAGAGACGVVNLFNIDKPVGYFMSYVDYNIDWLKEHIDEDIFETVKYGVKCYREGVNYSRKEDTVDTWFTYVGLPQNKAVSINNEKLLLCEIAFEDNQIKKLDVRKI